MEQPRARTTLPLVVALVVLAGAIVFHAAFPRYETRYMAALTSMRTDRWTGKLQLCRADRDRGRFVCGPATDAPGPAGS